MIRWRTFVFFAAISVSCPFFVSQVDFSVCEGSNSNICALRNAAQSAARTPEGSVEGRTSHEDSRISSESDTGALWRDHSARRSGIHEGRGARSCAAAEVAGGGGEGADPCRRARQRRWSEAGAIVG